MRRTRHVVLPVRSWQYVGFLLVSLACVTFGLVSRDREGRAGSLVGPELMHRAPHDVDACPNLRSFHRSSICADPPKRALIEASYSRSRSPHRRAPTDSAAIDRRRLVARSSDSDVSRRISEGEYRTFSHSSDPALRLSRYFHRSNAGRLSPSLDRARSNEPAERAARQRTQRKERKNSDDRARGDFGVSAERSRFIDGSIDLADSRRLVRLPTTRYDRRPGRSSVGDGAARSIVQDRAIADRRRYSERRQDDRIGIAHRRNRRLLSLSEKQDFRRVQSHGSGRRLSHVSDMTNLGEDGLVARLSRHHSPREERNRLVRIALSKATQDRNRMHDRKRSSALRFLEDRAPNHDATRVATLEKAEIAIGRPTDASADRRRIERRLSNDHLEQRRRNERNARLQGSLKLQYHRERGNAKNSRWQLVERRKAIERSERLSPTEGNKFTASPIISSARREMDDGTERRERRLQRSTSRAEESRESRVRWTSTNAGGDSQVRLPQFQRDVERHIIDRSRTSANSLQRPHNHELIVQMNKKANRIRDIQQQKWFFDTKLQMWDELRRSKDAYRRTKLERASRFLQFLSSPRPSVVYETLQQVFIIGICTMYGISMHKGKGYFNSLTQRISRFILF